jgi:internalin A
MAEISAPGQALGDLSRMQTPNHYHRWRYPQVTLRALILLIVLVGTWLGWVVNRAHIQRDAVRAIKKTGGSAWYDWQWKDGLPNPMGELWWPRWMIDRVGVDYFGHVLQARIWDRGSDEEMAHIGHLGRLDTLDLSGSLISDGGLVHVEGLTRLLALSLANTRISDAGLVHLKELTSLQILFLDNNPIDDAGLVQLKGLAGLRRLNLVSTRVTDAGLVYLRGLTDLETLALGDTQVTDAGLVHLESLRSLRDLRLNGTKVTDAGIKRLQFVVPKLRIMR